MRIAATLAEAQAIPAILRQRQSGGSWVVYEPGDAVPPELWPAPPIPGIGFAQSLWDGIEKPFKLLSEPANGEPLVADAAGRVLVSLDDEGGVVVKNLTAGGFLSSKNSFAIEEFDGDFSSVMFAVADSAGRCPLVIREDGSIDGTISSGVRMPVAPVSRRAQGLPVLRCEINHYLVSGQSLSVAGSNGVTTFDATDYRFSSGMSVKTENVAQTLVPLENDNTHGILFSAVNQLKFFAKGAVGYTPDEQYTTEYKTLASGHGVSGQGIDALSKGGTTGAYENGMFQVDEGVRLSGSSSYCIPGVIYIQNHANSGMVPTTYRDKLIQLKNNYASDITSKTNQQTRPRFFVYQSANEQTSWVGTPEYAPRAADGTLMACEVDPEIVLIGPAYWVPHADGVHFTGPGYLDFGQLTGKVIYKVCYRGEDWKPLQPTQIVALKPNVVFLRFNVPEPPLVLDTSMVTDPGNYGFELRDDTGNVGIDSVVLVGRDCVRIALTRALGTNASISYAWYAVGGAPGGPATGPRGNLRDSDTAVGWFRPQTPLYNWCVRFKKSIPYTAT